MRYFVTTRYPGGRLYVLGEVVRDPEEIDGTVIETSPAGDITGGRLGDRAAQAMTEDELVATEDGLNALAMWKLGDDSEHIKACEAESRLYKLINWMDENINPTGQGDGLTQMGALFAFADEIGVSRDAANTHLGEWLEREKRLATMKPGR